MPAPILHLGATVLCTPRRPGDAARAVPPRPAVGPAGGDADDRPTRSPAARSPARPVRPARPAQWMVGAVRVMAGGAPVADDDQQSVCVPTGTPMMPVVAQTRVLAT